MHATGAVGRWFLVPRYLNYGLIAVEDDHLSRRCSTRSAMIDEVLLAEFFCGECMQ